MVYALGRDAKARKRAEGETGRRAAEGRAMARRLVDWVGRWQAGVLLQDASGLLEGVKAVAVGAEASLADGSVLLAKESPVHIDGVRTQVGVVS